jgi:hypothetical protein
MRIDVTRQEFDAIINRLKGLVLKSEQKLAEQLAQRLDWQLHPSKSPESNGWAPIKNKTKSVGRIPSKWPSGHVMPDKKKHWSFDKTQKPKKHKGQMELKLKKKPTADEILASI